MMNIKFIKKDNLAQIMADLENEPIYYEFLALVFSSWHLDNVIVFLKQNNLKSGVIIVFPQSNFNQPKSRINESNFINFEFDKCVIYNVKSPSVKYSLRKIFIRITILSSFSKAFYFINPAGINLKALSLIPLKYKKIVCIIIDEGIGYYLPPEVFRINRLSEAKKRSLLSNLGLHKARSFVIESLKTHLIKYLKIPTINFSMFSIEKKMMKPRQKVCEGLCNYYESNNIKIISICDVIFFKDFKVIKNEDILYFYYNEIFDYLTNMKKRIIIKKHPNDTDELFDKIIRPYSNIEIFNYQRSGEQLVADLKPKFIIGGLSTVVFTVPFIYDIKSFSYILKYTELRELELSTRKQISFLYNQFRSFDNRILFINQLQEIK